MARTIAIAAALAAVAAPATAGELELSFGAGRATVVATDVPLAEILEEWARLGGTRFVNADALAALPVSVRMVDVPEREALRVLLRPAGGYVASSRPDPQISASTFDRVLIMTASRSPAAAQPPPAPSPLAPAFERPHGGVMPPPPEEAALPGALAEPDAADADPDDLELLEWLRRRYESAPTPAGAQPAFFPGTGSDGPIDADPAAQTTPRPGMIMQAESPAPAQPRRPSSRPRRRTGDP